MALIAGVAAVAWVWRHPTVLVSRGDGAITVGLKTSVGTTAYVGIVYLPASGDRHAVTITSARPRVTQTIPGATIDLVLCRGGKVGAAFNINRYCDSVDPVAGADLMVGQGTVNQIVARIHSDQAGRVAIEGVDVSYSSGWQRGAQTTGIDAVATFRR